MSPRPFRFHYNGFYRLFPIMCGMINQLFFTFQNRLHIGFQVVRAFEPLLEVAGVFLWVLFCQRLEDFTFLGIKLEEYFPRVGWVLRAFCLKVGIERSDSIRCAHSPLPVRCNTDEFLDLFYRFSAHQRNEIGIDQLECGVDVPGVPSSLERVIIITLNNGNIDFWVFERIEFRVARKFTDISGEMADIALFAAPYLPLFLSDTGIIVSIVDTLIVGDDEHEGVIMVNRHAVVTGQYGVNRKNGADSDNRFNHLTSPKQQ